MDYGQIKYFKIEELKWFPYFAFKVGLKKFNVNQTYSCRKCHGRTRGGPRPPPTSMRAGGGAHKNSLLTLVIWKFT